MRFALLATRTPFADRSNRFIAGRFGMGLFLASLGMLFATTLLAFFVIRLEIGQAWPTLPPLPRILWLSTIVIVLSSATMQWGVWCICRDDAGTLRIAMLLTLALALAFLALQAIAWVQWIAPAAQRWDESSEQRFALTSFYVLTGLHALHVMGGFIPMSVVAARAMRGGYSAADAAGVHYCAMYWHFLDGVWLVLFTTLMIGV